jgi:transposase-like protein
VNKYGFDRKGAQKFKCNQCGKQFTAKTNTPLSRMRYPKDVVLYALALYFRHGMKLREVAELLGKRGLNVSHVSVRSWISKFSSPLIGFKNFKQYTTTWRIGSAYIKVKGEKMHMWSVKDSNNNVLSIRLSKRKRYKDAIAVIKDAEETTKRRPETLIGLEKIKWKPSI